MRATATTRTARPPAASPGGDVARLRALVEDQHRRLRVYEAELGRPEDSGDIVESFPSRCPKPALSAAELARLIGEAEERLALAGSPIGEALRARWPERRAEIPVLRPSPGLPAYAAPAERPGRNAVVSLFGRDAAGRRAAIEGVLREQGRGAVPFVPVFLTNDPDFGALREARLVFEYYPFVLDETPAAAGPPADWVAYFVDMLQLTMRRWGVRRIVQA